MPSQYIAHKPRRASDENWVLTILSFTVIAVLCMFSVGYFLTRHWSQQEEVRVQQRQIETYHRNTAPQAIPASVPAVPPEVTQAQKVRAHLLAHPNVTPGTGFDKAGVQSTGFAIVDAIDQAQGPAR